MLLCTNCIQIRYDSHVADAYRCYTRLILCPILRADNPNADSVVVGITLTCVILLVLMTLTAAGYYFVYKSVTAKKGLHVVGDISVHGRMITAIEPSSYVYELMPYMNTIKRKIN